MKPRCITAVNAAAGRTLSQAEIDRLDGAFANTARRLARQDPQRWQGLSADQRTIEAGVQTMQDFQTEAALKRNRGILQLLRTADTEARITDQQRLFAGGRNDGLVRDMQNTATYIKGVRNEAIAGLQDLLDAVKTGDGATGMQRAAMLLFDVENPAMTRDLALEVFARGNGSTGNSLARSGADAWAKVIEPLRQRFNAAGGDVGRLDYGYLPTLHDSLRVLAKGQDAWAAEVLPLLDRRQYVNPDGTAMRDPEVLDFLRAAWDTISTDGLNKTAPGQFKGTGARANRGSDHRQIHFRDGGAYIDYQARFGRGSMYDAMIGHVNAISRDIGLVEKYGPNPETQMRLQFDLAERADSGSKFVFANRPEGYWRVLSGVAGIAQNARIAAIGDTARALQTAGKLGGAVLSAISDMGTFAVSTGYNQLGYWRAISNIGRAATPATREFMAMHGIIADSMMGDLNRFSGDHLTTGIASRLAQSTLKLSGLNAWTDTLRNAFELTMQNGLARMSRSDWTALSEFDRFRMEAHGITAADWSVIRQAQLTQHKGLEFLTPESIYATGDPGAAQVVSKVLAVVKDEGEYAVINPDLATRTVQTLGGQQAGTGIGELARAVMQFKSFPVAMVSRHWRRMLDTPDVEGRPTLANPLVYGAALGVSLMALGAVSLQAKQVASGKDPIDMTGERAAKFWLQAFVQGGGASILGDMILKDTTEHGTGFAVATAKTLLGPAIGTTLEAGAIVKDNIDKALKGKKTHTAADMIRVVRSNLPFVNVWYAKAAVDHMGLHALQENLSPGYLSRMQQRARKEWDQSYWWKPGSGGPERAPDIGKAAGQ